MSPLIFVKGTSVIDKGRQYEMPAKPDSLRSVAKKFGVSHELIRKLKAEGIDVTDEAAVNDRLSLYNDEKRSPASLPLTVPKNVTGTGLRQAIARLQACELAAHQDYLNALSNEPSTAGRYLKAWTLILDQLRKIEVDNSQILKENDKVIPTEELAKELGELFRTLRQDLDSLPRRIGLYSGKTKVELEQAVQEEVDKIIDSLFNCIYLNTA